MTLSKLPFADVFYGRPSQYGKYIDWDTVPHTTHDVATIFRRFLTQMPVNLFPV